MAEFTLTREFVKTYNLVAAHIDTRSTIAAHKAFYGDVYEESIDYTHTQKNAIRTANEEVDKMLVGKLHPKYIEEEFRSIVDVTKMQDYFNVWVSLFRLNLPDSIGNNKEALDMWKELYILQEMIKRRIAEIANAYQLEIPEAVRNEEPKDKVVEELVEELFNSRCVKSKADLIRQLNMMVKSNLTDSAKVRLLSGYFDDKLGKTYYYEILKKHKVIKITFGNFCKYFEFAKGNV